MSNRYSNPGVTTTIAAGLIPASGRVFQIRVFRRPSFRPNGTAFRKTAALPQPLFWAASITNTGSKRFRHDSLALTKRPGWINCGLHPFEVILDEVMQFSGAHTDYIMEDAGEMPQVFQEGTEKTLVEPE